MDLLPPGTILQLTFLQKRLLKLNLNSFIEVGPGSGNVTKLMLDFGMSGTVFEISPESILILEKRFQKEILEKRLMINSSSFLDFVEDTKVDLLISSMVLEHLSPVEEQRFVMQSEKYLSGNGVFIALVPANMMFWGIEDEIAGHFRRYSRDSLSSLFVKSNFQVSKIFGLTFPLSNMLLPLSNYLVKRSEKDKLEIDLRARTLASGHRDIVFKTRFPNILGIFLNKLFLSPFYLMQIIFERNQNSLVLYIEAKKISS
jgi:hypothetical protein